jgi:2-phosphoglycerate kinase
MAIHARFAHCIPFLLYISNDSKHAERFAIRAKYMTLEPRANKYIKYFKNIRIIQQRLCDQAMQHEVAVP